MVTGHLHNITRHGKNEMYVSDDVAPCILLGFKALRVPGLERLKTTAEQDRGRSNRRPGPEQLRCVYQHFLISKPLLPLVSLAHHDKLRCLRLRNYPDQTDLVSFKTKRVPLRSRVKKTQDPRPFDCL